MVKQIDGVVISLSCESHLCSVLHLLAHLCLNSSGVGSGFTAQYAHHVAQLHLGFGGLQQALPDQILHNTHCRACDGFHLVITREHKTCRFEVFVFDWGGGGGGGPEWKAELPGRTRSDDK